MISVGSHPTTTKILFISKEKEVTPYRHGLDGLVGKAKSANIPIINNRLEKMTKKLDKLLKQQERLKTQIQNEEAKTKKQNRKYDARRKILIGTVVMERMKKDRSLSEEVKKILAEVLTKDNDRNLFELSLLPKTSK